jgi:phage-related tail protein
MKNLEQAITELESIIEVKIKDYLIPETKGNSIKIDKVVIRPSKNHGFVLVDTKNNKTITTTFSKVGALAVAKAYAKSKPWKTLLHYDKVIEKNYNDSTFYKNIIDNTDSKPRRQAMESLLEITTDKIDNAKRVLDGFILSDIR